MLQMTVTYRDIELAMRSRDHRQQECVDWLLVQSVGFKNSAAMTCGHLLDTERHITGRGSRLLLHFHSSQHQSDRPQRQLKGFRVSLTGTPLSK